MENYKERIFVKNEIRTCKTQNSPSWWLPLARSDTASIAITHSPPPRSKLLRPPLEELWSNQMEKLVKTSRWWTPSVFVCSTLARSDTANNAITHSPPPKSKLLRPPREELINRWKTKLVETSRWRILSVCGHSMLARSDTATVAITHSPPPRSTLLRPPREDLWSKWMEKLVETSRWCTASVCGDSMLARSDTAKGIMKTT
jgi:hypothetical protein